MYAPGRVSCSALRASRSAHTPAAGKALPSLLPVFCAPRGKRAASNTFLPLKWGIARYAPGFPHRSFPPSGEGLRRENGGVGNPAPHT